MCFTFIVICKLLILVAGDSGKLSTFLDIRMRNNFCLKFMYEGTVNLRWVQSAGTVNDQLLKMSTKSEKAVQLIWQWSEPYLVPSTIKIVFYTRSLPQKI